MDRMTLFRKHLTNNEENAIVSQARIIASCGHCISIEEFFRLGEQVYSSPQDTRLVHKATMKTIRGMFAIHKTLAKIIIQALSMDPKRTYSTKDMQDGMLFKADGYIKMLKALGLVGWEST